MELDKKIGDEMRKQRTQRGLSLATVADRITTDSKRNVYNLRKPRNYAVFLL